MHRTVRSVPAWIFACTLLFAPAWWTNGAGSSLVLPDQGQPAAAAGGEKDFDFEIGTWTTRLSRLDEPLTGSTTWIEYTGTTIVRSVWDGRANLVELDVSNTAGSRIVGLSLRLYNPDARQWSLNYANRASGTLTPPVTGEFKNGRGEFFGVDTVRGRTVLVRFVIIPVNAATIRFEQSFSDDGGKSWEPNWIAVDTRKCE